MTDPNRWADRGGGVNGFADRIDHYVRLALAVLGYAHDAVRQF